MAQTQAAPKSPRLPGEFTIYTAAMTADDAADGPRRFRAVASSTVTDLAGNTISLKALHQLRDDFRNGLTIFMDHDYTNVVDKVFGTSDTAEVVQTDARDERTGAPIYDLVIAGAVNEPNPKAVQLHDSIKGGYVKFGTSIGAIVRKHTRDKETGGMLIDSISGKEASIVGIPKNQRSWAYKASVAASDMPDDEDLADDEEDTEEQVVASNGEVLQQWVVKTPAEMGSVSTTWQGTQTAAAPTDTITITNADLSAKARDNLDASEFACPEKRLYPINDAAHVRAALSRVADPSNDQCGKEKILAAARKMGIGDHKADITDTELLEWALTTAADSGGPLVRQGLCAKCGHDAGCDCTTCDCASPDHGTQSSVTDLEAVTSDDTTPGGQDAPHSEVATPETAPTTGDVTDPAIEQKADIEVEDVAQLVQYVAKLVDEIGNLRLQNAALLDEVASVKTEQARLAGVEFEATETIRKVMELPLRRRAVGHVETLTNRYPQFDPRVSQYIERATRKDTE